LTELERELRSLAGAIEFPPTPDLVRTVRPRLAERRARPLVPSRPRLALVLALVVLVAVVGAVFAVPSARTALLEWLGIRGVKVTRVDTVPTPTATATEPTDAGLALGERVSVAEAQERAGFQVAAPPASAPGPPDEVYLAPLPDSAQVAFVWRGPDGSVDLLLTQARASLERDFVHKLAGPDTRVDELSVGRGPALWLEGEPHAFAYVGADGEFIEETLRLAGNTLLWEQREFTLRLEGDVTRAEALRIAQSVRIGRD